MDRRRFLQVVVAGGSAAHDLNAICEPASQGEQRRPTHVGLVPAGEVDIEGHAFLCSFTRRGEEWKVYEELRVRDGVITFVSSTDKARVLAKTAEGTFAEDDGEVSISICRIRQIRNLLLKSRWRAKTICPRKFRSRFGFLLKSLYPS